ncbi:MAG: AMP-binding protein [Chitinophagales bacterium]
MNALNALNYILHNSFSQYADREALYDTDGHSISYAELSNLITGITEKLNDYIGYSNVLVGILSEKNIHVPALIYSVLNSGNAYMPVDYRSPFYRILQIIQSARPAAFVIQAKFLDSFCNSLTSSNIFYQKVSLNSDYWVIKFIDYTSYTSNLAYVLFTSGSTGIPKGIMHTHQSALTFLNWCKDTFNYPTGSRFISIAPFQFDLSVFDLFYPLICGGSLLLPSAQYLVNSRLMTGLIEEKKIEVIYSTPSFFSWLLTTGKPERHDFTAVKSLQVAGELFKWSLFHALVKQFSQAVVYNLYGPTETNVCTACKVSLQDEVKYPLSVPIGEPCNWASVLYLETSVGAELSVSGPGIMAGYINQSGLQNINGKLYYNTGDIVEQVFDRNLAYISRSDRMVKKNGFRIEPAEIELCLNKLSGVMESHVMAHIQGDMVKLFAFMVSKKIYDFLFLKNYCQEHLPYYMVPDNFIFTDEFPMNSNHKIDNATLLRTYNDKQNNTGL